MIRKKLWNLLALLILLSGCSLFSPEREIFLKVPSVPKDLIGALAGSWTLELAGEERFYSNRTLDWSSGIPDSLKISCPRETEIFVLLYPPSLGAGPGFFPAGARIGPEDSRGSPDFRDGAGVFVLSLIFKKNVPARGFNSLRFLREMRALDKPWQADRERLVRQIQRKAMRSWYIREQPSFEISLQLPEGLWYQNNLSLAPLPVSSSPVHLELPRGYCFFYCPARALLAEVQVDKYGEALVYLRSISM